MKPIIGILCTLNEQNQSAVSLDYTDAILEAGGLPWIWPITGPEAGLELLDHIDGLMVIGGRDVDPGLYRQAPHPTTMLCPERDALEIPVLREALARRLPILGICRGCQVLAVAAGGTLIQDIPALLPQAHSHHQKTHMWQPFHDVELLTPLTKWIFGATVVRLNSFHHQAVDQPGKGFVVAARSADGVVEMIEAQEGFALGLQCHPEGMWRKNPKLLAPFRTLVEAAENKEASEKNV